MPWPAIQRQVLARFPAARRDPYLVPTESHEGLSGSMVWRVAGEVGSYCLRVWPVGMRDRRRIDTIHRALYALRENGFPCAPVPFVNQDGSTCVDWNQRFWELLSWMPGAADYHQQADTQRLAAAARVVAQLHCTLAQDSSVASRQQPSPALQQRLELLGSLLRGGQSQLESALDGQTRHQAGPAIAKLAREAVRLFPQRAGPLHEDLKRFVAVRLPLQLCHGDLWHDHLLFEDREVTGVIDFGNLRTDTPVTDLARLLGSLVGDDADGWRAGLRAYESVAPLTPDQRVLLPVLDRSSLLLSAMNWVRWIYVEQRRFPWPTVHLRLEAILQRL